MESMQEKLYHINQHGNCFDIIDLMQVVNIRQVVSEDQPWVTYLMQKEWGADLVVVHGDIFIPSLLPGFIADIQGKPSGFLTYWLTSEFCEVITLNSLYPHKGIGTLLLEAVISLARQHHCPKVKLTTTNDNTDALRFYQKRGFFLTKLSTCAVNESRKIKPQIPLTGNWGIPIRDEIELTYDL